VTMRFGVQASLAQASSLISRHVLYANDLPRPVRHDLRNVL
jgi:hypothetical protein